MLVNISLINPWDHIPAVTRLLLPSQITYVDRCCRYTSTPTETTFCDLTFDERILLRAKFGWKLDWKLKTSDLTNLIAAWLILWPRAIVVVFSHFERSDVSFLSFFFFTVSEAVCPHVSARSVSPHLLGADMFSGVSTTVWTSMINKGLRSPPSPLCYS